jgi:hypothetical protein
MGVDKKIGIPYKSVHEVRGYVHKKLAKRGRTGKVFTGGGAAHYSGRASARPFGVAALVPGYGRSGLHATSVLQDAESLINF